MARDGDLRQLFRKHLPKVFWTSCENFVVGRGTPDSFGCYNGVSFWIEFKEAKHWAFVIRPEQIAWHLRLARNKGTSWIAVRRAKKELWLVPGAFADKASPLDPHPSISQFGVGPFRWDGSPARWDWDAVLRRIITPPSFR